MTDFSTFDEDEFIQRPIVWSIAGSDNTGGAGIQADLKTLHNLGCDVCTIITANTAQNSKGVQGIFPVESEVLAAQLDALLAEKFPSVIKIGLLANSEQVEFVANYLMDLHKQALNKGQAAPKVVYDPVAIASAANSQLTEDDILPTIKKTLLPMVDVLTPNAHEAELLSGIYLINWNSVKKAAHSIAQLGVASVVIKGGHNDIHPDYCMDFCLDTSLKNAESTLLQQGGEQQYGVLDVRLDCDHNHGTGCTYASAIAACLAQGYLMRDAITVAKAYIHQGLSKSQNFDPKNGAYQGIWQGNWPMNKADYPTILLEGSKLAVELEYSEEDEEGEKLEAGSWKLGQDGFTPMADKEMGLYPVVDSLEWLERLLSVKLQASGFKQQAVNTIQLRVKQGTHYQNEAELEALVEKAVAIGKKYDAQLFINDHWQLALKYGAYGVHLGQEDVAEADLASLANAGIRLGISTHGEYELLLAQQIKPSYLAVGAIFPTVTKDMTGQIQGVERLRKYRSLVKDIPIVAIGGINHERCEAVWATGVESIAVVTAITLADDPEAAVEEFFEIMQ